MNGIKGYISIREASYRWGVSERRVNQYCAEGHDKRTNDHLASILLSVIF